MHWTVQEMQLNIAVFESDYRKGKLPELAHSWPVSGKPHETADKSRACSAVHALQWVSHPARNVLSVSRTLRVSPFPLTPCLLYQNNLSRQVENRSTEQKAFFEAACAYWSVSVSLRKLKTRVRGFHGSSTTSTETEASTRCPVGYDLRYSHPPPGTLCHGQVLAGERLPLRPEVQHEWRQQPNVPRRRKTVIASARNLWRLLLWCSVEAGWRGGESNGEDRTQPGLYYLDRVSSAGDNWHFFIVQHFYAKLSLSCAFSSSFRSRCEWKGGREMQNTW